ncbi:YlbF family regulator [Halanaerobium sp. Z-7514]|uniref:YlbF family regulator n=1 Tax=Halanaerobium polyolivorans TaxID=2886943 RepID=A0AAW4WRZ9_9FIRM|nr:YlbF family regulator [Halanaerobium polyolivorans]MCC3143860.1 YlbF family regulator [Halanaerobium polyolivorans]RQD77862.1 MAG: YlbF family regulator [Halanaerobium sp. MSAO_Bac5]
MATVINYAEELADAIVESSEFQELKEKEEIMVEDDEAKSMLDDLNAKYQQVQMMQQNGQEISDEQKQELSMMEQKMKQNEKIAEFYEAQNHFNQLMNSVNQVITDKLQNFDEAEAE